MTIPPWTYSRLSGFETCPKQFYHLKVLRDVKDPPTVHTIWGERVHTAFENAINDSTALPDGMKQWQNIADKFMSITGAKLAEYKFAISSDFKPTQWDNSWSRGIADLVVRGKNSSIICDWKSGKKKPTEQLALYAAYEFHHNPATYTVHTAFVWLASKEMTKEKFTRAGVSGIWQELLPRIRKMEDAYKRDSWPARPSGLCKNYCSVVSCKHHGSK